MPYCGKCGSPLAPNVRFCGNCGAAQNQAPTNNPPINTQPQPTRVSYYSPPTSGSYAPPPPPPPPVMQAPVRQAPLQVQSAAPMPQMGGEVTVGVILLRRMRSLGRYDTFAGVVTSQRLIFAQMTSEMLTAAAQQARDQAKAEGKGFWGQWADQLRGTLGYTKKYETMQPQAILAETPGNFALYNNTISQIDVHLRGAHRESNQRREFKIYIHSSAGTYEYHMEENSDFTDTLKRVYGDRVKMPFGYFGKSINIKI